VATERLLAEAAAQGQIGAGDLKQVQIAGPCVGLAGIPRGARPAPRGGGQIHCTFMTFRLRFNDTT
jgi:hypothetical protein